MGAVVTKDQKIDDNFFRLPQDIENLDEANEAVERATKDLQTRIELTLSCQHLPKLDFLSQTDAKIVCYLEDGGNFMRHDSTEVIPDSSNPAFEKKFLIPYNFEKPQTLKFEIYDVDEFKDQDLLAQQELIGHCFTTLHQIVCSQNQTVVLDIIPNKTRNNRNRNCGTLKLTGREIDESVNKVSFNLVFNPYNRHSKNEFKLELAAIDNPETSIIKMPDLKPLDKKNEYILSLIPSERFTLENSRIKFRASEIIKGRKTALGEAEVYLSQVVSRTGGVKAKVKFDGYDYGEIKVKEQKEAPRFTFLNYVDAGAEISLIIAMDFTKSNREPTDPMSLHYCMNDQDNEYLRALKSIGNILQHYDSDNRIPLYGFGAKMPPYYNVVSNCFSLNGNYFDPEVVGLEEVIKVYKEALTKYKFHGPTIFSELLKMATDYIISEQEEDENANKYFILLIMTDGDINDFEKTRDQIIMASKLPMSVIIIGIGNEKFTQMQILDGDDEVLTNVEGVQAARDIVQFVPFSKYKDRPIELAKETLKEVPKQFLEYMRDNKIEPNKKDGNKAKAKFTDKIRGHANAALFDKQRKTPIFLERQREKFYQDLSKLEINPKLIERILEQGIPSPDINLVFEILSHQKSTLANPMKLHNELPSIEVDMIKEKLAVSSVVKNLKKNPHVKVRRYRSPGDNVSDFSVLNRHRKNYSITHQILHNKSPQQTPQQKDESWLGSFVREKKVLSNTKMNLFDTRDPTETERADDPTEQFNELTRYNDPFFVKDNACLHCKIRVINTILFPCGHAAFCTACVLSSQMIMCKICKQKIKKYTVMKK